MAHHLDEPDRSVGRAQQRASWGRDLSFTLLYVPIGVAPMALVALAAERALGQPQQLLMLALSGMCSLALLGVVHTLYQQKTEIQRQNAILERMARTDPLTGLGNRRSLWATLEAHVERHQGAPAVLLAMDLNGFKQLNDTHGHVEGDRALELVAHTLRSATRADTDALFRVGGDEFVILLPDTTADEALGVAARLHEELGRVLRARYGEANTGGAIGLAARDPDEAVEAWLHRADLAMYTAKDSHSPPLLAPPAAVTALPRRERSHADGAAAR